MKVKQAERLVTAQDDATFAYHSQPQDLSASQAEERASLRRRKQAAESRLEDLERSVERLKRTAAEGSVVLMNSCSLRTELMSHVDDRRSTSSISLSKKWKRPSWISRTWSKISACASSRFDCPHQGQEGAWRLAVHPGCPRAKSLPRRLHRCTSPRTSWPMSSDNSINKAASPSLPESKSRASPAPLRRPAVVPCKSATCPCPARSTSRL